MARTTITAVSPTDTGYNLTDSASFATLSTGDGNGVSFTYDAGNVIVLRNSTGGAAAFTVKVPTPAQFSGLGITISDLTVNVAAGKDYLLKQQAAFKQSTGNVYVDCNVAGKVLVLDV